MSIGNTSYTPDDLLSMTDGDQFELVNGQLKEKKVGYESSWIAATVLCLLRNFCSEHKLGWVAGADASFKCFPQDPNQVRKPDVSFIRADRLPRGEFPQGHCEIAPDLAVEVVSPNDTSEDLDEKVQQYLDAGIPHIWLVHPRTRSVQVYRLDQSIVRLRESDELVGEGVLAGFRCPVSEFFPPR